MFYVFEVIDKTKRKIRLTNKQWRHIKKEHADISNKFEDIEETLINPSIIRRSEDDHNISFYYQYFKNIKINEKYLVVVVKYLNGKGFIITSFYTDKIKGLK
ncbi:hypothetical protein HYX16_04210 [Candidatus Woesearchaeota archaeon]|nr:hypothetical protein [Candidatus Woesearchaeota archaeon]